MRGGSWPAGRQAGKTAQGRKPHLTLGVSHEGTEKGRVVLAARDAKGAGREGLERFEGRGRGLPDGRPARPSAAFQPVCGLSLLSGEGARAAVAREVRCGSQP